jgi:predicted small metal-binding protein
MQSTGENLMFNSSPAAMAATSASDAPVVTEVTTRLGARLRTIADQARELLKEIELHIDDQHQHAKATHDVDEMERLQDADPYRWLADARHAMQSGFMFAGRAAAQPVGF